MNWRKVKSKKKKKCTWGKVKKGKDLNTFLLVFNRPLLGLLLLHLLLLLWLDYFSTDM